MNPPRLVPINAIAAKVLRAMIEDNQLLFRSKTFGKRCTPYSGMQELTNVGEPEKGSMIRVLRSYFASELKRRNTNPLIVQNLFAHSDMSVTTVYGQTDDKMMLDAVKRLDD